MSSSSSLLDESSVSDPISYKVVFNSSYMQQAVAYFAQENASDFSINEYLSPDLIEHQQPTHCSCCLCQLREKNGCTLDVCIRKHPSTMQCQQIKSKNPVCSVCMDSMTLITKRLKNKMYCCIADSCAETLKTLPWLRSHYLKHLKVKWYTCGICEKGYNKKHALKTHERGHVKK